MRDLLYNVSSPLTPFVILTFCQLFQSHRINPVEGSTVTIQSKSEDQTKSRMTFHTGYKRHVVGSVLHGLTLLTFFGWFALLMFCTYLYYMSEGEDILMSLRTFCVVWVVSFIWNCSLLWPHSIESIFLRRCRFEEATHVAIFHETDKPQEQESKPEEETKASRYPAFVKWVLDLIVGFARQYFTLVFADPYCRPDQTNAIFQYCPVMENEDGSRYLVFVFRRYIFNELRGIFLAGVWPIGTTLQELCPRGINAMDEIEVSFHRIMFQGVTDENEAAPEQAKPKMPPKYNLTSNGLSTEDYKERYRVVGPNVMEMEKQNLLKMTLEEIAKPFYIYQIYIVWIWVCIDYLYATVLIWAIVLLTGFIISWFRYRGAQVLYSISHVSEQATVLRDGQFVTVDQVDLVPGDIVNVSPGVIHCDMLLLTGETVVDESALTGEATPQAKSPADPSCKDVYDAIIHKKHTLSAGTRIVESDDSLAIVIKTASNTTKGELMRDVLAFRTHHLKIRTELKVAISLLTTYSTIFFLIVFFTGSDEVIIAWFLGM